MNENEIVEKIFQTLQRREFASWFNAGDFDKWITGDGQKTDAEIKTDIAKLFNLN